MHLSMLPPDDEDQLLGLGEPLLSAASSMGGSAQMLQVRGVAWQQPQQSKAQKQEHAACAAARQRRPAAGPREQLLRAASSMCSSAQRVLQDRILPDHFQQLVALLLHQADQPLRGGKPLLSAGGKCSLALALRVHSCRVQPL